MDFSNLKYFWWKATFDFRRGKFRIKWRPWRLFFIFLFLEIKSVLLFGKTTIELFPPNDHPFDFHDKDIYP